MTKTLSSGRTYYGPSWLGEVYDAFTNTKGWLYGGWSKEKLDVYTALRRIPAYGDYMDYLLDIRGNDEYLVRYGMDYSDIHDPRKLSQTNSGSRLVGSAYHMYSRNISELYR